MTLQSSGQISMNNINTELGQSSTTQASLNDSNYRALVEIPSGAISMQNFYGKSNITTLSYSGNPTVTFKGANGAWGNNPEDDSSWPYCIWLGGQGERGSGTVYYPFVSPGGNLYFTCGCDNTGYLSVATTANRSANPTALSYTTLANGVGFPGQNSWVSMGSYASGTIMWFKCDMYDSGGDWGYTFAISTTNSSSGIVLHSRSNLGADSKPQWTF